MIEIILTSSVLILALVILRRVLRGRIDPRVQYALWLLVAARLLIPGTLFTAPVSVVGAVEDIQTSIRQTVSGPVIPSASPATPGISAAKPVSEAKPPEQTAAAPAETTELQPDIPESGTETVQEPDWPVLIWKTGIAVTGGAMLLSNLTFYIRLRRNRRRLTPPAAPWSGNLPVYGVEGLPSPCLFGLFRPAVYLNEAAMNAEHPEHIFAHEYAHYRHGDHLWSVLRCVCAAVHWYNPLVWTAAALCRRDCELACDASALRQLGEDERIDYGQTLLGMVAKQASPAVLLHTATTMTAGKRAMTERIALIIRQPRTRKITLALVAGLACVLAACTFSGKAGDGTSALTPEETALLEFPGLHWNDSMETVMETLGITEEQIVSIDEINPGEPVVTVKDFQYFGETTQNAYFYFKQYAETQDEPGLIGVRLDYPDDMDFAPVREQLARLYGEGSEDRPDFYEFSESGSIQLVEGNSDSLSDGFRDFLKGVYGEELLERRAAILEEPGPHRWYWASDNSVLSDEFVRRAAARIVEAQSSSARPYFQLPTQETAEELVRTEPSVYLWWADAAPIGAFSITTTVNQVQWNAAEYVSFLQYSEAAEDSAALLEYPGLHWNDSVETVMETLGITEADFIHSVHDDSDHTRSIFSFIVEDIPIYGYTAQYVLCAFTAYAGTGSELGLCSVEISFPDDMEDFDAVRDELVQQFGPADRMGAPVSTSGSMKDILGDRYDRWIELQRKPGVNTAVWYINKDILPEKCKETLEAAFLDWQSTYSMGMLEDFLEIYPIGTLTWCSNSLSPTFNTVTFDGSGYVFYLQTALAQPEEIPIQPAETASRSQLFEYPGLHWNDPLESVMETLGVTEADLIESGNSGSDVFSFTVGDVPLYGYTAQYATCYFTQAPGTGNGLGLYCVEMSFPDDMEDFDSVQEELTRQFGPASGVSSNVSRIDGRWRTMLGGRYDRWVELQQKPGVNTVYWNGGTDTIPEGYMGQLETAFARWQTSHPEDTLEDYLERFTGRLTWCSNSMWTPTFNTVTFQGGGYFAGLQLSSTGSTPEEETARSIVLSFQAGEDAGGWLPFLNGIDWADVRQAAVDEGLDDGDGSGFAVDILESVSRYVEQHWTDLDEGSYMDILTATKGLDGAVSESYAGILYQLYCQDPTLFATIVLDKLSVEDRDAALRYLLYDWSYFHRLDESLPNQYQEQLQILLEQLEEDRKGYLRLSPDALVFSYEGEVSQLRIVNDMAALSYSVESSNPEVASVEADDGIFTVTAVSPGEATILVHCFTGGEEQELSCSVFCGW